MVAIDTIQSLMACNGYAYFNIDAFLNRTSEVCYIPENADDIEDCYNYDDLVKEVTEWKKSNEDYFKVNDASIDDMVFWMFTELSWEFPITWLESKVN